MRYEFATRNAGPDAVPAGTPSVWHADAMPVRRAAVADVDVASSVLADAFADYPWTRWTIDAGDHVSRVRRLQRLFMSRIALPYGEVWLARDDDGEVVAVAVWGLPGATVPASVSNDVETAEVVLEGARHEASLAAEAVVSGMRPSTPHYYLGAVGTRRDRQRRGHGATLLAPMLERADAEGADVFLETSSLDNVAFYERLGFVTVAEADIPDGGPHVWAMSRPLPRAR